MMGFLISRLAFLGSHTAIRRVLESRSPKKIYGPDIPRYLYVVSNNVEDCVADFFM